jgi:hypothetical protein
MEKDCVSLEKERVLSFFDRILLRFIHLSTVLSDIGDEVCSNFPYSSNPPLKESSHVQGE